MTFATLRLQSARSSDCRGSDVFRMFVRALRAALLTRGIYNQAGDDPMAILHATGIVILAGLSLGLGLTGALIETPEDVTLGQVEERLVWMWVFIITTLVGWIVWSVVAYMVGSRFLSGGAGFRKVLRAIGIVYGPGVLLMLLEVPILGDYLSAVGLLWILVAGVVALHEVQDIDWLGAVLAAGPGWFIGMFIVPAPVIGTLFGPA